MRAPANVELRQADANAVKAVWDGARRIGPQVSRVRGGHREARPYVPPRHKVDGRLDLITSVRNDGELQPLCRTERRNDRREKSPVVRVRRIEVGEKFQDCGDAIAVLVASRAFIAIRVVRVEAVLIFPLVRQAIAVAIDDRAGRGFYVARVA